MLDFHLYSCNNIKGIPKGAVLKNANKIISIWFLFIDSIDSYASFSDWFQFKLLYEKEDWWSDMDFVCSQFFDVEDEYCCATEILHEDSPPTINIGNIKVPAKGKIMQDCLEIIDALSHGLNIIPRRAFGVFIYENNPKL